MKANHKENVGQSRRADDVDDKTEHSNKIQKIRHACTVEAHGSTSKRMDSTLKSDRGERVRFNKS